MTYEELIPHLKNNHFYPNTIKVVRKNTEAIVGLWLVCMPILSQSRLERLREVLPVGFSADYISNKQEIHIQKIK